MPAQVLPFDQALATVLEHARALPRTATENVPLLEAPGRVLAAAVLADRDQPPFPRSTRDGYAVRAADLPSALTLLGSLRAGESWQGHALQPGQAIEIMTGAPLPEGADAVLMVEHAVLSGATVVPARTLAAGDNVVPRGAEAAAGAGVLRPGTLIAAAEIAVAASCGCTTLPVFIRPTCSLIATGDELVELGTAAPHPWEIYNSNTYALSTLVTATGATPVRLPLARDTREDIRDRITRGLKSNLIVLSGGVSMGKYDLVEEVLAEFDAEFFFTGAKIQPGKPIVFGRIPSAKQGGGYTYFFGLPGNPVSTQVTFHLFVAPILRALAGQEDLAPRFVEARLAADVKGGAQVTRFLPADLTSAWDAVTVRVVGWQGSGDVAANARGTAYAVLPAEVPSFQAGQTIRVLLR